MSVQATTWAWSYMRNRKDIDGTGRMVLLYLADCANQQGEYAFPSVKTIAEHVGVMDRQVQYHLSKLKEAGLIEVQEEAKGRRPTAYRFPMMAPGGVQSTAPQSSPQESPKGVQSVAPQDAQDAQGCSRGATGVQSDSARTSYRNQEQDPKEPSSPDGDSERLRGFEEFWQAYPQRNGKRLGRRLCEGMWAHLSLDERRAAWRGARNYAQACEAGVQGAMDPERFLKHRRWEDWQTPADIGAEHPRPGRAPGQSPDAFAEMMRQMDDLEAAGAFGPEYAARHAGGADFVDAESRPA